MTSSGLQRVSGNLRHFQTGRWALLAEGALLCILGVAGLLSAARHADFGTAAASVPLLTLTPWHSALLLLFGILGLVGAAARRVALIVTTMGAVVFLILVMVGAVATAHGAPGPLGFEARGIVLHGVVATINFAVLYWLIPDKVEGPAWVRDPRRKSRPAPAAADRDTAV